MGSIGAGMHTDLAFRKLWPIPKCPHCLDVSRKALCSDTHCRKAGSGFLAFCHFLGMAMEQTSFLQQPPAAIRKRKHAGHWPLWLDHWRLDLCPEYTDVTSRHA